MFTALTKAITVCNKIQAKTIAKKTPGKLSQDIQLFIRETENTVMKDSDERGN